MPKIEWTKEKLREVLKPLLVTLNRNATIAYHRHLAEDSTDDGVDIKSVQEQNQEQGESDETD